MLTSQEIVELVEFRGRGDLDATWSDIGIQLGFGALAFTGVLVLCGG